jgi:hypothetical protein
MLEYPHTTEVYSMINLHQRYNHYLATGRKHDRVDERIIGYGWTDDGSTLTGYYVQTENHRLYYDLNENFKFMETWVRA